MNCTDHNPALTYKTTAPLHPPSPIWSAFWPARAPESPEHAAKCSLAGHPLHERAGEKSLGRGRASKRRGASCGDIATMPAGDAFSAGSAAQRPPPALAAPVCPRWRSVRGRPSPPWPRGRAWRRAGAAAASAGAAMAARGRFHRRQRRDTAAAGPGSPGVPSLEVCPRAPQRALAAGAGMGAHRRRRSERPPSSPRRLGTKDTAPKIPKFAQTTIWIGERSKKTCNRHAKT